MYHEISCKSIDGGGKCGYTVIVKKRYAGGGTDMNEWKLSENMIRLRHEKKITQEELASFAGVTKASVSKWENGVSQTKGY